MKTTMKFLLGAVSLMFICSNLNAQNPIKKERANSRSIIDGIFRSSKVSAQLPLVVALSETTSPYFKVKQTETVKYQLDSLVAVIPGNSPWAKIDCKYDSLGRIILFYVTNYNATTKIWEFSYKYCYKYGDNYLIKDRYDYYSSSIHFERNKTEYDASGRIYCIKSGTDSINFESTASPTYYIYDNNRLMTKLSCYSYPPTPYKKVQYYYDSNGRDTAEVTSSISGSVLTSISKVINFYDTNNDRTNLQTYDYSSNSWRLSSNLDFLYTTHHDCTSDIEAYYYNGTVESHMKYLSSYDESISNSDIYSGDTFENFPISFQSKIKQMDLYQIVDSKDSLYGNYYFYYSPKANLTGLSNRPQTIDTKLIYNAESKTIMLQNSASGNSTVIQLYTLSGKMILNKSVSTSNAVSVNNLEKGIYMYKLINAGATTVGKILVQ